MLKKILPVLLLSILTISASSRGPLTDFRVKTLKGETVSEDIFSDYDITMVNVWATWCGPCVREMPEIQNLYTQLPANTNIVTFCLDAADSKKSFKRAEKIVKSGNVQFPVLLADQTLGSSILSAVNSTGIPTTVFVDSKGNIIGDPVIGAPRQVVQYYKGEINKRLQMLPGK